MKNTSFSESPIDLSSSINVFGDVDTINCILYVPALAIVLYKCAKQWEDFVHIEAIDDILSVSTDTVYIDQPGQSVNIQVCSIKKWEAFSNGPWLTLSSLSNSGNEILPVTAKENSEIINRETIFKIWTSSQDTLMVTVTRLGTANIIPVSGNTAITIYPNPVSNSFKISGVGDEINMELFDTNWRQVSSKIVNNNEEISINSLPKGIYLLKLLIDDELINN